MNIKDTIIEAIKDAEFSSFNVNMELVKFMEGINVKDCDEEKVRTALRDCIGTLETVFAFILALEGAYAIEELNQMKSIVAFRIELIRKTLLETL